MLQIIKLNLINCKIYHYIRVPTAQGKQGKWSPKNSLLGNMEIWPKHKELVCSTCKFPYSKGKDNSIFAAQISNFYLKLDKSAKSVLCM